MTLLTENPFPLIMLGVLVASFGFTFGIILKNRKLIFLGVFAVTACLSFVFIDISFETTKELMHRKLHEMARCVRKNDVDALLSYVSQNRKGKHGLGAYNRISNEMPSYMFRGCRVSNIRLDIEEDEQEAKLTFVAFVNVDASRTGYAYDGPARREVALHFEKEGDDWKVVYFDHWEPMSYLSL